MSNRIFYFAVGMISLIIGSSAYVIFRDNTYLSLFISEIFSIKIPWNNLDSPLYGFVSYYLPDLLWALSLCCGLFAIFYPNRKMMFFSAITTFLYGMIWEILQYYGFTSGTGDIYDVIMYLTACIIAVTIYEKKEKTHEKN